MKHCTDKRILSIFLIGFILSTNAFASIHLEEAIIIGGIKQSISIKGADEKNPVLLFLHGGPGNSVRGYDEKFTKDLQKYFTVIQWDQRGVERTAKLNASDKPLTVQLMEDDAVELINYLRKRFSQNKIYLVGHSWGGFLGMKIADDHPELLQAYFAVSPMIYQDESERLALEWLKVKAVKDKNAEEIKELDLIHVPFQTGDDLYYHRKWLLKAMGTTFKENEAKSFIENWSKTWLSLYQEACHVNFFQIAPEIKCPIYFLVGDRDRQTNFKLTDDYFKMLKAEKKELFWFAGSGHNLPTSDPVKFQEIIVSHRTIKN